MSILPTVLPTARAWPARDRLTAQASANANASNMLEHRGGGEAPESRSRPNGRRGTDACHFGTSGGEPLWNGPRLKPTFVAQVLGQVMMDASARPRAAYPKIAAIAAGSFFDTGV